MFARDTAVRTLPPAAEVPEEGYEEPFPLVAIEAPVLTGKAGCEGVACAGGQIVWHCVAAAQYEPLFITVKPRTSPPA